MRETHRSGNGWTAVLALLVCAGAWMTGSQLALADSASDDALSRLGLVVEDVSADALHKRGLQYAVKISRVLPGTAAERGGLEQGDLIYQLNDLPVYSAQRLLWLVNHAASDEPLAFRVLRDEERRSYDIERLLPTPLPPPGDDTGGADMP